MDNPIVLCFDRDFTVDVNFDAHRASVELNAPGDAEPVPLAWVQHYAHAVDGVDVWATGNQRLREEAMIPGIREARSLWESRRERGVESVYESPGYLHDYKPGRRDGLRLIADVYEAAIDDADGDAVSGAVEFVVVDDVDLSDMAAEWGEHFFPWEFVECERWRVDDPVFPGVPACSEEFEATELERGHDALDELERAAP